jgi:hypothetical protein
MGKVTGIGLRPQLKHLAQHISDFEPKNEKQFLLRDLVTTASARLT